LLAAFHCFRYDAPVNASDRPVQLKSTPLKDRRRARRLRVARWLGLVLCVALGAAWWLTGVWSVSAQVTRAFEISFDRRAVWLIYTDVALVNRLSKPLGPPPPVPNITAYKVLDPGHDVWQPQYMALGIPPTTRTVLIPIWMLLALALVPTGLLWRAAFAEARRRRLVGHCHACGYNRVGLNADAPCPECGRKED